MKTCPSCGYKKTIIDEIREKDKYNITGGLQIDNGDIVAGLFELDERIKKLELKK